MARRRHPEFRIGEDNEWTCFLAAALLALSPAAAAVAAEKVTAAESFESFNEKFCRASRRHGHIFVVPLAALQGHTSLSCDFGEFTLRVTEPSGDPGHYVINIDPPASIPNGLTVTPRPIWACSGWR